MLFLYRRIYFIIFTIIFFILLPVLVVYSLGYNIDFSKKSIQNSLSIRIEAVPISSKIKINNKEVSSLTPADIRILDDKNIELSIEKEGYLTDSFVLSGKQGLNTTVKIAPIYLLDNKPELLTNFNKNSKKDIAFVAENIIYTDTVKNIIKIRPTNILSNFTDLEVKKHNEIKFDSPANFNLFSTGVYFDFNNKILIWENSGNWNILDLKIGWKNNLEQLENLNEFNINSLVSVNKTNILFTNKNNYLYQLNLKNLALSVVDTETISLSQTTNPTQTWVFNNDGISLINQLSFDDSNNITNLIVDEKSTLEYVDLPEVTKKCLDLDNCNFKILNTLAGNIILIDNSLFYYQLNLNTKRLVKLGTGVSSLFATQDVIFYVNDENNIFYYNTITNKTGILTTLLSNSPVYYIKYIDEWKRLVVFQENLVSSVWYDKGVNNDNITKYNLIEWTNKRCSIYIFDLILLCKNENDEIVYFQNNKLI